jgi:hypothetical protein
MARFIPIPAIPTDNIPDWEVRTLSVLKTNIELLTAIINKTDPSRQALLKRSYTLPQPPLPTLTSISAPTVTGFNIAVAQDSFGNNQFWVAGDTAWASMPTTLNSLGTISDLEALRIDVANIRASVEAIIMQFRTI